MKLTSEQQKEIVWVYTSTDKSTRDIAQEYACAYNTINKVLKLNGVNLSKAKASKISAKSKGNSNKRGIKLSPEGCANISKALQGRKSPTLGKKYTVTERANISNGVKKAFATAPTKAMQQARHIGVDKINKARNQCKMLLRRVLKLTGAKKATKTYALLGYTEKELIAHIEAQFTAGMSWDNRASFHIDHIVPVSWFVANGITDPKVINALSNLQTLNPTENRRKGNKYDTIY